MSRSWQGWWGCSTVHDGEIRAPRPDRIAVLFRHHASDLRHMPEVVRDPRGQQLPQRYRAEFRVLALERELGVAQPPRGERGQVLRAQGGKFVEQLAGRLS